MDLRFSAPSRTVFTIQWPAFAMPKNSPFTVAGPCRDYTGFPILPDALVDNRQHSHRDTARYSVSIRKVRSYVMESQRSGLKLFGSGTKSSLISVHQGYLPLLSQVVEDRLTERPLFFDRFVPPNLILHFCHMFLCGLRYLLRVSLAQGRRLLMLGTSEWACRKDRRVFLEAGPVPLGGSAPNGGQSSKKPL